MKNQVLTLVAVGGAAVGLAWGGSAPSSPSPPSSNGRVELPQAVKDAVQRAHPNARIEDTEREKTVLTVYEVDVVEGGAIFELKIAEDGTIVEVEQEITWNELPAPVAETITRAAGSAQVREIERKDRHARAGFLALAPPDVTFEAEWERDGREVEVVVASDGSLIGGDDVDEHEEHEHDDD